MSAIDLAFKIKHVGGSDKNSKYINTFYQIL
jgi:hypothetical protein